MCSPLRPGKSIKHPTMETQQRNWRSCSLPRKANRWRQRLSSTRPVSGPSSCAGRLLVLFGRGAEPADEGKQERKIQRLGEQGGGLQPGHFFARVTPGCDEDHGNLREVGVALLKHPELPAVDDRHREIEQDHVRAVSLLQAVDRLEAVAGAQEIVSFVHENLRERLAQGRVVLDDEDLLAHLSSRRIMRGIRIIGSLVQEGSRSTDGTTDRLSDSLEPLRDRVCQRNQALVDLRGLPVGLEKG